MEKQTVLIIACLLATVTANSVKPIPRDHSWLAFNRRSYPSDFIFGAGSAAYQSEGGAYIDGKGPSIWDTFTKEHPEKISDHSNGNIADDFYHRYKGDIQLMKNIGLDTFRFSISWSRVLPKGKISGGVNPLGVLFYNNLINELLANGIIPFVTLFHWDLPQALQDEYSGFLSSKIVDDYKDYVDFCFKTFGDRVKHWCTLNEPLTYSYNGYNYGAIAPGRCSPYMGNCTGGNSATEPYIVAHNLLLSHAAAVKLYKTKYQAHQKGIIGITLVTHWFKPQNSSSVADQKAADRQLDFFFGWFAHPITYGDYPKTMKTYVGKRLPKFTESQSKMLKGSIDFLGVNYYTTYYIANVALKTTVNQSYTSDSQTSLVTVSSSGVSVGTPTALSWLFVAPEGIHSLMLYIRDRYKNPPIYITENGMATLTKASLTLKENLMDGARIHYHYSHLKYLLKSVKAGVNVKGYYLWSFFDDFEWDAGFTARFGIVYVDFKHKVTRNLKFSAYWLKSFLLH